MRRFRRDGLRNTDCNRLGTAKSGLSPMLGAMTKDTVLGRRKPTRAVICPTVLSSLDSFLSKTQLPSLLPLSSWCCRNRLDQHRRRNVVAFNCRRVLGSTPNR
jgi:hypothetical protein